jgi:hypothetical protein
MEHFSKHTPSFGGRKAKVEPKDEQKSRLGCTAYGCTRIGAISNSSGEEAKFVCWIHNMVNDPLETQKFTAAIHQNEKLVDWVDKLTVTPWIDLEINDSAKQHEENRRLEANGLPELKRILHKTEGKRDRWETQSLWIQRLRNYVWWVLDGRDEAKREWALGINKPKITPRSFA